MQIFPTDHLGPQHASSSARHRESSNSRVGPDLNAHTQKLLQATDGLNHQGSNAQAQGELKQAFADFVGQTMFGQMIKSMRSSQQPSAYFHGGRAEEIFQGQFDQVLAEQMSQASADSFADPMFELFMLKRQA